MSLLTIGTVAFDDIETPFGKADKVIGGACTYASYAASYFTDNIRLCSIVGADFPMNEIRALENRGVDMEGLQIKQDGLTFFWAGKYHENMNQRDTLVTDLNVLDDFNPVLPDSYKDSKYVMLGNLTPEIQIQVMDQLDGSQKLIVLDTMNLMKKPVNCQGNIHWSMQQRRFIKWARNTSSLRKVNTGHCCFQVERYSQLLLFHWRRFLILPERVTHLPVDSLDIWRILKMFPLKI